jgi:two-component system response regulator HydG
VTHIAGKAGELIESIYRPLLGLNGQLDIEGYGRLINEVIRTGGCASSTCTCDDDAVHFTVRGCEINPPGQDTAACELVRGVAGSIAARNFGCAMAVSCCGGSPGQPVCEFRVELKPGQADRQSGLEGRRLDSDSEQPIAPLHCQPSPHKVVSAAEQELRPSIVGRSQQLRRIVRVLETVAPTAATVLITGETGVGKECLARALHGLSDRWREKFIGVNCGAIAENLIESALFGHERGAFTGAHARHIGYFERANGGTLFLDEIDSLSADAQVRLLRVLQEGEYERVGGRQPLRSGGRIVAATNGNLQAAIETGRFRRDLYYRLNVINVHVPPLRDRPEDIPVLVDHILEKLNQRYGGRVTALGNQAMRMLLNHHWPGNVRELENVLERSYLFATGPRLDHMELDLQEGAPTIESAADGLALQIGDRAVDWNGRKKAVLQQLERQALEAALVECRGNVTQVAEAMGFSRRAIYLKLRSHGIEAKDYRA